MAAENVLGTPPYLLGMIPEYTEVKVIINDGIGTVEECIFLKDNENHIDVRRKGRNQELELDKQYVKSICPFISPINLIVGRQYNVVMNEDGGNILITVTARERPEDAEVGMYYVIDDHGNETTKDEDYVVGIQEIDDGMPPDSQFKFGGRKSYRKRRYSKRRRSKRRR